MNPVEAIFANVPEYPLISKAGPILLVAVIAVFGVRFLQSLAANSFVFKEPVFNYSGQFSFPWDEIKLGFASSMIEITANLSARPISRPPQP